MSSKIYIGWVTEKIAPNEYNVWLPMKDLVSPIGAWEYVGENVGGVLHGAEWEKAKNRAKSTPCIMSSELTSGSWFKYLPTLDASVFNNRYKDGDPVYDYRIVTQYKPPFLSPKLQISMSSDFGAGDLSPCAPTLNVVGGHPVPAIQNIAPGKFIELKEAQKVLVVYPEASSYGIIVASIPSDRAYKTMIK